MKGYKGMCRDMTCRGFQFEVGKSYHADGEIRLCRNGFHFCRNLYNVFDYYTPDHNNRFFEIEAKDLIISAPNNGKSVTSDIMIIRELSDKEIYRTFYGDGYGNGDRDEDGNRNRNGYGFGYGDAHGGGNGCGYGDENGNEDGNGLVCGNCYWNVNIQKVMMFI